MKRLIVIFVLLSSLAHGSALPDYPFVYVISTAKKEVAPDTATIVFRIETSSEAPEKAYATQSATAKRVIEFARSIKIDENAIVANPIQKSFRTVLNERNRPKDSTVEPEYELTRVVTVRISDLSAYGQLVDFLYKQDAVVDIRSEFGRSDVSGIEKELVEDACRTARKKADSLAVGFGKKVKTVRAISEEAFEGMSPAFGLPADSGRAYGMSRSASDEADFRFIPLTIEYQRQVYALFEIE